ncbi:hypothetical protein [Oscillatoria sp. FACHB-1406]|uniref:hypothetical protein n=1 Tax=Oscillatoria sp. FACHB-1406 TaxID=2692846 RepID=UPI001684A80E|nr:hypothetical protein [Oscillatoria sp. FACHB-1406]
MRSFHLCLLRLTPQGLQQLWQQLENYRAMILPQTFHERLFLHDEACGGGVSGIQSVRLVVLARVSSLLVF